MILPYAVAVLAALWLASLGFGTGSLDYAALNALSVSNHPELSGAVILVTALGGWEVLAIVTVISAALLALQRRFAAAGLLLAITLSGRVLVEVQKWTFGRSRPEEPLRLLEIELSCLSEWPRGQFHDHLPDGGRAPPGSGQPPKIRSGRGSGAELGSRCVSNSAWCSLAYGRGGRLVLRPPLDRHRLDDRT